MKKTLIIEGMSCQHCVRHVTQALEEIEGVTSADVSLESKSAVVDFEGKVDYSTLENAVKEVGYTVKDIK